jgi:hypothetical protein
MSWVHEESSKSTVVPKTGGKTRGVGGVSNHQPIPAGLNLVSTTRSVEVIDRAGSCKSAHDFGC